jgi:hypothetical protein
MVEKVLRCDKYISDKKTLMSHSLKPCRISNVGSIEGGTSKTTAATDSANRTSGYDWSMAISKIGHVLVHLPLETKKWLTPSDENCYITTT